MTHVSFGLFLIFSINVFPGYKDDKNPETVKAGPSHQMLGKQKDRKQHWSKIARSVIKGKISLMEFFKEN